MKHDTAHTVAELEKYAAALFAQPFTLEVFPAEDHDSLRADGEPVASVLVDDHFEIYPFQEEAPLSHWAAGKVKITKWAVDRIVDASDPSVGIFGGEPVEDSDHSRFDTAVARVVALVAEYRANNLL